MSLEELIKRRQVGAVEREKGAPSGLKSTPRGGNESNVCKKQNHRLHLQFHSPLVHFFWGKKGIIGLCLAKFYEKMVQTGVPENCKLILVGLPGEGKRSQVAL